MSFRIPLFQSQLVVLRNLALSYADLKLYIRSTCIHNWDLQRYFMSNINISNNASSFQTVSIVTRLKDVFHILTENYALSHVYKKNLTLCPLFMDGFQHCLKARTTLRRHFFLPVNSWNSWYSFY